LLACQIPLGPGDIVGISLPRSIEMIIAVLAVIKTGAAYMPLDPHHPHDRIRQILGNAKPKCLITSGEHGEDYTASAPVLFIDRILEQSRSFPAVDPSVATTADHLVYVLHTSGSTGVPKGVCMGQNALINLIQWQIGQSLAKAATRTLQFSPLTFDVSFQEIFSTLATGGTLVLITDELRSDPIGLLDLIYTSRINRIFLPFVALQALTEHSQLTDIIPAGLEEVMTAGEQLKITPQIVNFFSRIPGAILYNQYGPTEAHVVSQYKLSGNPADWPKLPPIGNPITNSQLLILNNRLLEEPPGVAGELCIGGACLADGYLNNPEMTTRSFIRWNSPRTGPIRIYRTGDMARIRPDGAIEFLGRRDSQVKIRGFRIELGEIESSLNTEKDIRQAVVTTQEDNLGNTRLVAYLITKPESETPAPGISKEQPSHAQRSKWKEHLRKTLPEYMIPHEFIVVDHLPLTATGKIDRRALPRITRFFAQDGQQPYIAPRTPTEEWIAGIWSRLLNLDKISVDADFFELGGHSLIGVKVMVAIEKNTGRRLPLSTLFENSTIEKLSRMLTIDENKINWDSLVAIKPSGTKKPVYLIHGAGLNVLIFNSLGRYMDQDQPVYALQALGLNGKAELLYSIEEIAAKYCSELLAGNPNGPFALAGYSLGGFIAFEMAKQLRSMGKEVRMLAILDTYAGNRDPSEKSTTRLLRKIIRQFRKLAFFSRSFIHNPGEIISYQAVVLGSKIRSLFAHGYKVDKEFFTYEQEVNHSYEIAYNNYRMTPTDIEVDLFRVKKRINYIDDRIYMGWNNYARGVRVHEVPGDHKTFLFPPNDAEFAAILQKCLDQRMTVSVERHPDQVARRNFVLSQLLFLGLQWPIELG